MAETRRCKVLVGASHEEATFHQFGSEMVYGSDNEPRSLTIAIVELKNGKVLHLPPKSVTFLDQPK